MVTRDLEYDGCQFAFAFYMGWWLEKVGDRLWIRVTKEKYGLEENK